MNKSFKLVYLVGFLMTSCFSMNEPRRQVGPNVKSVPTQARSTVEPRKRILVLPILDESKARPSKVLNSVRAAIVRRMAATGQFLIIQNSDFPRDIGSFLKQGSYDLQSMAPIAGRLGISIILEGKLKNLRAERIGDQVGLVRKIRAKVEATIGVRLVTTDTGRELMNTEKSAVIENMTTQVGSYSYSNRFLQEDPHLINAVIQKAFAKVVFNVSKSSKKLSWEGRIAMITGDRIYINAGRASGIQVGDILRVSDEGQDVFDPESGELIGRAPGRMKGTIEIVSYFGKDGSIAVVHSGSGFRDSDKVEIY